MTAEETKQIRGDLNQTSDLSKKLQASLSELRRTVSERDEEIRTLRAELKQADDRTWIVKGAISERDEEIKSLREELKQATDTRDEQIRKLQKQAADGATHLRTLQEDIDSLKQLLGAGATKKRKRLEP